MSRSMTARVTPLSFAISAVSQTVSMMLPGPGGGQGDRKSTRLNSSHGYISYAVFCLKKKQSHRRLERWTGTRLHSRTDDWKRRHCASLHEQSRRVRSVWTTSGSKLSREAQAPVPDIR